MSEALRLSPGCTAAATRASPFCQAQRLSGSAAFPAPSGQVRSDCTKRVRPFERLVGPEGRGPLTPGPLSGLAPPFPATQIPNTGCGTAPSS